MKLTGKIIITSDIKLLTGMHIGGSSSMLDIGGIDMGVIKSVPRYENDNNLNRSVIFEGVPYIPGSSIKGKLRNLLAREVGSVKIQPGKGEKPGDENDEGHPHIVEIFGSSYFQNGESQNKTTRLAVSDASLNTDHFVRHFNTEEMELPWTEGKWENTINRRKGSAENPRQIERVPAGAVFQLEMIYDVYDYQYSDHIEYILKAMQMLEDDYLGGSGTRGYGRVQFNNVQLKHKSVDHYYSKPEEEKQIDDLTNEFKSMLPSNQS